MLIAKTNIINKDKDHIQNPESNNMVRNLGYGAVGSAGVAFAISRSSSSSVDKPSSSSVITEEDELVYAPQQVQKLKSANRSPSSKLDESNSTDDSDYEDTQESDYYNIQELLNNQKKAEQSKIDKFELCRKGKFSADNDQNRNSQNDNSEQTPPVNNQNNSTIPDEYKPDEYKPRVAEFIYKLLFKFEQLCTDLDYINMQRAFDVQIYCINELCPLLTQESAEFIKYKVQDKMFLYKHLNEVAFNAFIQEKIIPQIEIRPDLKIYYAEDLSKIINKLLICFYRFFNRFDQTIKISTKF